MSAIPPVGSGAAGLAAGRDWSVDTRAAGEHVVARQSPDAVLAAQAVSPAATVDMETADGLAVRAGEVAIDYVRLLEWADRLRNAALPCAPLVQRPAPDGDRPGYPNAIEAYREMTELVKVL